MADNDRVTTREFYDALLDQNDRMDETERRIVAKLDAIRVCFVQESKDIHAEIADVRVKSNRIDGVISAALILGNSIAIAMGIKQN